MLTLVNSFFRYCHTYMPIYDPSHDTWEKYVTDDKLADRISLVADSPLSLTVLLGVAQRTKDFSGACQVLTL